jgi:hypothetical protein
MLNSMKITMQNITMYKIAFNLLLSGKENKRYNRRITRKKNVIIVIIPQINKNFRMREKYSGSVNNGSITTTAPII